MVDIRQGDCLDLMCSIDEQSVDMICCDLPYGITNNAWDKVIPFESMWDQYHRVIKPDGAICLFAVEPFATRLRSSNMKEYHYDWCWFKHSKTGFLNARRQPLRAYENILVFYKKQPVYHGELLSGPLSPNKVSRNSSSNYRTTSGKIRPGFHHPFKSNIIDCKSVACSNEKALHPTQKPVGLMEFLIDTYTDEGDTILDNCMGSGTTGVAAIRRHRNFIGYELDSRYFSVAQIRMNEIIENG
jgi:site-specific DNA-methyltransferase (adenine-specific)